MVTSVRSFLPLSSSTIPNIDECIYFECPQALKAPQREYGKGRDQQIRDSTFSPQAFAIRRESGDRKLKALASHEAMRVSVAHNNVVKDKILMAQSSQRGKNIRGEAVGYYAVAIEYDNIHQFRKVRHVCYPTCLKLESLFSFIRGCWIQHDTRRIEFSVFWD